MYAVCFLSTVDATKEELRADAPERDPPTTAADANSTDSSDTAPAPMDQAGHPNPALETDLGQSCALFDVVSICGNIVLIEECRYHNSLLLL